MGTQCLDESTTISVCLHLSINSIDGLFFCSVKYRRMQQKCEEKDGNDDSQERRLVASVTVAAKKSLKMLMLSGCSTPVKVVEEELNPESGVSNYSYCEQEDYKCMTPLLQLWKMLTLTVISCSMQICQFMATALRTTTFSWWFAVIVDRW